MKPDFVKDTRDALRRMSKNMWDLLCKEYFEERVEGPFSLTKSSELRTPLRKPGPTSICNGYYGGNMSVIHRFVNKHNSQAWYEIEDTDGKYRLRGDHTSNWVEYYLLTPAPERIRNLKHSGDWHYTVHGPEDKYQVSPRTVKASDCFPYYHKCTCEWSTVYAKGCQCGGK